MQQFSLEKWLQDKSRKVVTRTGEPVEIVLTDWGDPFTILGRIGNSGAPIIWLSDGRSDMDAKLHDYDLFFADEEEELTEFEQKLVEVLKSEGAPIGNIEKFTDKDKEVFHCYSKQLLDLAKKEIFKDLPKWKKGNDGEFLYETSIVWTHNETKTLATAGLRLDSNTFYIPISELEKLSKEE